MMTTVLVLPVYIRPSDKHYPLLLIYLLFYYSTVSSRRENIIKYSRSMVTNGIGIQTILELQERLYTLAFCKLYKLYIFLVMEMSVKSEICTLSRLGDTSVV